MKPHSRLLYAVSILGGAALLLTPAVDRAATAEPWRARVSPVLQAIHDAQQAAGGAAAAAASGGAHLDALGRVEADVYHACGTAAPTAALTGAGFAPRGRAELPPLCVVEGWVSPEALPAVAAVAGVTRVTLPSYVRHRTPRAVVHAGTGTSTIDTNGVHIIRADEFLAQAGGGGKGVTVGVQSSGIENISVIEGRGELPSNVPDYTSAAGGATSSGDDEGTMLLEEVHAVAPDASLAFCEPGTFVQYTACLQQFVTAGVTIALDDEQFLDQDPMNSAGTASAALTTFLASNPKLALFTSAGNDYGSYWQGNYAPVTAASLGVTLPTVPGSTCTPATDLYVMNFTDTSGAAQSQILTTPEADGVGDVPFTLAWGDPPGTNSSTFDVYFVNPTQSSCVSTAGLTSAVLTQYISIPPGNNTVYIATADASLAGKFLKLWVGGDGLSFLSLSTVGSPISPQTFSTGAITIGAVNGSDGVGNTIESYSSRGPISVLYPQATTIQAPVLVAPDGINVDTAGTDFAGELFPDGNFYGTSASVPNAAAAAALLRGAFPQLTVPQVLAALQSGAAQLGSAPPDGTFGYGRVDIMGAVGTFPAPTMTSLTAVSIDASTSTTSSSQAFSVTGFGALHFTVTSSNPTLVPSQVAAAGSPGVNVAPSGCGSSTLSCTLTVTAAQYQGGMATVTVAATDGAGRQAPATIQVNVTNPKANPNPPAMTSGSGGSGAGGGSAGGGGGGGGAIDLWAILALTGFALHRVRRQAARR